LWAPYRQECVALGKPDPAEAWRMLKTF